MTSIPTWWCVFYATQKVGSGSGTFAPLPSYPQPVSLDVAAYLADSLLANNYGIEAVKVVAVGFGIERTFTSRAALQAGIQEVKDGLG